MVRGRLEAAALAAFANAAIRKYWVRNVLQWTGMCFSRHRRSCARTGRQTSHAPTRQLRLWKAALAHRPTLGLNVYRIQTAYAVRAVFAWEPQVFQTDVRPRLASTTQPALVSLSMLATSMWPTPTTTLPAVSISWHVLCQQWRVHLGHRATRMGYLGRQPPNFQKLASIIPQTLWLSAMTSCWCGCEMHATRKSFESGFCKRDCKALFFLRGKLFPYVSLILVVLWLLGARQ